MDQFVAGVGVELRVVAGCAGSVEVEGDAAVPGSGEGGVCGEEGDGDLAFGGRGGRVDGEADVGWEGLSDGAGEGLGGDCQ